MTYQPTPDQPQHRRSPLPWVIALALLTVIVGLLGYRLLSEGDPEPAAAEPSVEVPSVRLVEPVGEDVSPTPEPAAPAKALKLGQTHSFTADVDQVAVTALAHKRYGGYEAVQVRTCNKGTHTFPVSTLPWMLSYSGGEELSQDTVVGGGLAAPEFTDRDLAPGKCAKGWISWEPAKTGKPDGIEYHIDDYPNASTRWEW